MIDISGTVHSVTVAVLFSAIALRPKGRALTAMRILCGFVAIYFVYDIFREIPIWIAIDPALAHGLARGADLLALAAILCMLVSSYRYANREPEA
jgi:CRISPR/Cas system-associated protein Csm6